MSLIQLIKASFFDFKKLKEAQNLSLVKIIGYLFLLSAIFTIPMFSQVTQAFQGIQADSQAIAEKIPPFSIVDNKLTPEDAEEGFIYQTDSIILTFDPQGKRTPEDIANDLIGNFLSIGLLPDYLVIGLPNSDIAISLLGSNPLLIPYSDSTLNGLNNRIVQDILSYSRIPWWVFVLIFLVALYPSLISLTITLLLGTLFANFYSRILKVNYSFLNNLKIIALCFTLPVCLSMLIRLFNFSFDASTFILLFTVFIYPRVVKIEQKTT